MGSRKSRKKIDFYKMKLKPEVKKWLPVTDEEVEKMVELRNKGLSYQSIAEELGRAKLTVLYHLKDERWREKYKADTKTRNREWYLSHKDWKREYYKKRREQFEKGELVCP